MFQNLKDMEFGLPKPFTGSKDYKGGGWLGVFDLQYKDRITWI